MTSPTTLLIGLSGPSSSGKTTLARLLRSIFNTTTPTATPATNLNPKPKLNLFILHEDDFYKTDTDIPRTTFSSPEHGTRDLDDWDCVGSLDLPLLRRVLGHVKACGTLPDDFASKEDQNTVGKSGVDEGSLEKLRRGVEAWLGDLPMSSSAPEEEGKAMDVTVCLLDGFLLYPDPTSGTGTQERELYDILRPLLSLKLFIPSTRAQTIERRTKRTGYVTLEGFWEDPPGYVEDVVWPNYARDHAWLFGGGEVREAVDAGSVDRDVAAKEGILVGPGRGEVHLKEILPWAVERVKEAVGRDVIGREMRSLLSEADEGVSTAGDTGTGRS